MTMKSIYALLLILCCCAYAHSSPTLVQSPAPCTSASVVTASCSMAAVATGDGYGAFIFAGSNTDVVVGYQPVISSAGCAVNWISPPYNIHSTPPGGVDVLYCPSATGGATSISVTSTSGNAQVYDIFPFELSGAGNLTPVLTGSMDEVGSDQVSVPALSIPSGNAFILSILGDSQTGTFTPTSGFAVDSSLSTSNYLKAMYSQTVSSAGSYGNMPSYTTSEFPLVINIAFSSENTTGPRVVQAMNGGGTGGYLPMTYSSHEMAVPIASGDTLVVCGAWQSGAESPMPVTDSLGNQWTRLLGEQSDYFGCFWVPSIFNAGRDTITVTPASTYNGGVTVTFAVYELAGVDVFDLVASNLTTGTTPVTASLTTSFPNELVLLMANSTDVCNAIGFTMPLTGWTWGESATSHCASSAQLFQLVPSPSTVSATLTGQATGIYSLELLSFAKYARTGGAHIMGNGAAVKGNGAALQ